MELEVEVDFDSSSWASAAAALAAYSLAADQADSTEDRRIAYSAASVRWRAVVAI